MAHGISGAQSPRKGRAPHQLGRGRRTERTRSGTILGTRSDLPERSVDVRDRDAVFELVEVPADLGIAAVRIFRNRTSETVLVVQPRRQLRHRQVASRWGVLAEGPELSGEAGERT